MASGRRPASPTPALGSGLGPERPDATQAVWPTGLVPQWVLKSSHQGWQDTPVPGPGVMVTYWAHG